MNARSVILIAAALVALMVPFVAADGCQMGNSPYIVTAGGYYLIDDFCHGPACIGFITIYQESNGAVELQRGDEVRDDTCGGLFTPDTYVF